MRRASSQHAKRSRKLIATMLFSPYIFAGVTCVACALLFMYITFQGGAPESFSYQAGGQSMSNTPPPPVPVDGRYTVVMNTWKRHDLLRRAIPHYLRCPEVDAMRVVWSESPEPPEELLKLGEEVRRKHSTISAELIFDIHKSDSLNNRFKPLSNVRTSAVLSVDDDLIIPCATLALAMRLWMAAPEAMVGFVPRLVAQDTAGRGYLYKGWWSVWWHGSYNMVLTKAALFHHKYLSIYTHSLPPQLLEYIHVNRNCEDIAMSFLVANVTKAPALWVRGAVNEMGSSGISSLGGHIEKRTQCVNKFVEYFHNMPLVETSAKIVDATRELWW